MGSEASTNVNHAAVQALRLVSSNEPCWAEPFVPSVNPFGKGKGRRHVILLAGSACIPRDVDDGDGDDARTFPLRRLLNSIDAAATEIEQRHVVLVDHRDKIAAPPLKGCKSDNYSGRAVLCSYAVPEHWRLILVALHESHVSCVPPPDHSLTQVLRPDGVLFVLEQSRLCDAEYVAEMTLSLQNCLYLDVPVLILLEGHDPASVLPYVSADVGSKTLRDISVEAVRHYARHSRCMFRGVPIVPAGDIASADSASRALAQVSLRSSTSSANLVGSRPTSPASAHSATNTTPVSAEPLLPPGALSSACLSLSSTSSSSSSSTPPPPAPTASSASTTTTTNTAGITITTSSHQLPILSHSGDLPVAAAVSLLEELAAAGPSRDLYYVRRTIAVPAAVAVMLQQQREVVSSQRTGAIHPKLWRVSPAWGFLSANSPPAPAPALSEEKAALTWLGQQVSAPRTTPPLSTSEHGVFLGAGYYRYDD